MKVLFLLHQNGFPKSPQDFTFGDLCSPPQPSPSEGGRCEKNDLTLFHVIPAKAGIQRFQGLTN
jgi:hypothetical protein